MSVFCPARKSFWLQKLCETNYRKLVLLAPDLALIGESAVARAQGKPALYLHLLERSPYTLTVELTHDFAGGFGKTAAVPAVRIRVCLDAKTAEMLSDHCRPDVLDALREDRSAGKVLDYKWSLNYFLARWLDHCVANRYRFGALRAEPGECLAAG